MIDIYIYGASGHGKVVLESALHAGWNPIAFIDDNQELETFQEFDVLPTLPQNVNYIIAIGNNSIRQAIEQQNPTCNLITVINPTAYVSSTSKIDRGTLLGVKSIINSNSKIGKNCIINSAAVIEHDCVIQNFVHVSPNATVCGNVFINDGTHVGAGAVILPNVRIGKWVVIGAGAVVIKDLPDGVTAVGNPARILK